MVFKYWEFGLLGVSLMWTGEGVGAYGFGFRAGWGLRFRAKTNKNARNGLKIDRCRIGVQVSRFGV